jgi:hypothetical protein
MEAAMTSLEARVEKLEDLEQIRKLFVLYKRHLDVRDLGAYSRLFARDGEWLGGTGRAVGPAGIEAMLMEKLVANQPAPGRTHYHLVGLPEITLDGDRASAEVSWALITRGEGDVPELTLWGHYSDQLVREDGEWRFLRRVAHTDIPHRPLDD